MNVRMANAVVVIWCMWACVAPQDGRESVDAGKPGVWVQVEYPAAYATRPAGAVDVVLVLDVGEQHGVTNDSGEVWFGQVPPGRWPLRATRPLSSAETHALTGHSQEVTLTAEGETQVPSAVAATLTLHGPTLGGLVIREFYYSGSPGVNGNHYFSDQFLEVYNNSTDTQFVDGLCVADLHGPAGSINPGTMPTPYGSDVDSVVAENIWRIPGSGAQYPLLPGQSLVVAHDGTNHQPFSPLDLSDADFESYNQRPDQRDSDSPTVPNLAPVLFNGGFDWLIPVFGGSVVVFRCEDPASLEHIMVPGLANSRVRIPVAQVLDAVDALMDRDSGAFKRVPSSLDRGFAWVSGTYSGESLRRRLVTRVAGRAVVMDTGDSGADFEVANPPTPRGVR